MYTYSVDRDSSDGVWVARALEFPSLAAHGGTEAGALAEIKSVVAAVVKDIRANGGEPPISIAGYIASFGSTKEEIAERLRTDGHRGRGCMADSCPIAIAIRAKFPRKVEVYYNVIRVDGFAVEIPDQVLAFVDSFDDGLYLDLDVDA